MRPRYPYGAPQDCKAHHCCYYLYLYYYRLYLYYCYLYRYYYYLYLFYYYLPVEPSMSTMTGPFSTACLRASLLLGCTRTAGCASLSPLAGLVDAEQLAAAPDLRPAET